MSCNCSRNCPEDQCLSSLTFVIDDGYLVPRLNGVPLEPVSLTSIAENAETNTRLQLDQTGKRLVYTSEDAQKGTTSPDYILVSTVANLIAINDLSDVEYSVATDGDVLSWNGSKWVSYTVPAGTIVTPVGVDADGRLVKDGTGGTPPAPDTIPLGGILIWPAPTASMPTSFKECNGQAISRTVYADLFALLGTTYGSGDGTTSFNLPNMQTRSVAGLSSSGVIDTQFQTIGQTGGAKTVSLTGAQNGVHSHTGYTDVQGNHNHNIGTEFGSGADLRPPGQFAQMSYTGAARGDLIHYAGSHSHNVQTYNSGSGTPHENLPPYITMPYAMRVI